ncbi:type II toxin-antitoxin system prevent-host-death family antitoxin [Nonomuraea recticatena]
MPEEPELSVAEFRAKMADVLNDAAVRGQITFITNRGRRVAAVVPVPIAEEHLGDRPT